jgi:hypothetical protein
MLWLSADEALEFRSTMIDNCLTVDQDMPEKMDENEDLDDVICILFSFVCLFLDFVSII